MSRRRALWVGLAIVVVLLGSLSTARAKQIFSVDQARSDLQSARSAAHSAISHAARIGVGASALQPVQRWVKVLDSQREPVPSLLWDVGRERWYQTGAQEYRRVSFKVSQLVSVATTSARVEAQHQLAATQNQLNHARNYDVDGTSVARALAAQRTVFQRSSTPLQYAAVAQNLILVRRPLHDVILAKQKLVATVREASHDSQPEIVSRAESEAASLNSDLDLLQLLSSRATTYRTQISTAMGRVKAVSSPFDAAVRDVELEALLAQIKNDLSRAIPEKMIVVSTETQTALMYENGVQVYSAPVTTGGPELPTDQGVFHIYTKISPFTFHSPWPEGSPYYYPPTDVQFWMPFDGAEGLHDASWRSNFGAGSNLQPTDLGTGNSILGTHGCVNLPSDAAAWVWDWAPIGTTVVVT